MDAAVATNEAGANALTAPSDCRELGGVIASATPVVLTVQDVLATDTILAIGVGSEITDPPLPADIRDLLMSTARFAEAVLRLDRRGASPEADGLCYDSLAAVKLSLRRIAWSRALE
ncbi:MAG: hypothetical protein WB816_18330 [Methylocystis sp.]